MPLLQQEPAKVLRRPRNQLGYMTLLAWLGAFLVFQGGRLLGFD